MWVTRKTRWHKDVLPLEKFLTERIIQRCDYNEIISNKHRTSSGYIHIKELINIGQLSLIRSRSVRTLVVLLNEATDPLVKQNIVNDEIIIKYFIDLKRFIAAFPKDKLLGERNQPNLAELQRLLHQLKIFEVQLDLYYFPSLKKAFLEFDYADDEKFQTKSDSLSQMIDLLIPFLSFKGYSIASVSELLISWLKNGYRPTAKRIFDFFQFKERHFTFLQYLGHKNEESDFLIKLIEIESRVQIQRLNGKEIVETYLPNLEFEEIDSFILYTVEALDPHNFIRKQYDNLLKRAVMQKERQSLSSFNSFFDGSFWAHSTNITFKNLNEVALQGDSINVGSRGKTLRETLFKCQDSYRYQFESEADIPLVDNPTLKNAIYYYNLALGSKSIENSLSLLWTAIETIIPYRNFSSDIECVQEFIANALAVGAISRDINGFALRFIQSNQQNGGGLNELGTREFKSHYSTPGLEQWFKWLSDNTRAKERFAVVKECSELLAFQYASLGMRYHMQSLDYLAKRILSSKSSIKYQLQRIYLHRNQIVHAGDLVNEYTNLWMHLEWYVGKLLAYFVIEIHYLKKFNSLDSAFRALDAEQQYLLSYLDLNRSYKIRDINDRIKNLLFDHPWRAF